MHPIQLFSLVVVIFAAWWAIKLYRQHRAKKLFAKPIPAEWVDILNKNVGLYSMLPDSLRTELHGHIQLFLDEKEFIGQEISITDEIQLTIAGNACILLLQRKNRNFNNFTSIIVYPDTYVSTQSIYDGHVEHYETSARAGESWVRGPVVLSWKDVLQGSHFPRNGHNVVLHEFAHKLDEQNNVMNGQPILREQSQYSEWTTVFREEFDALQKRVKRGTNKVLDEYGTVSPPEFFAVATESFFEKPRRMKKHLPDLYTQLNKFYCVDPAAWHRHH